MLRCGVKAKPAVSCTEFSGLRSVAPSARATGLATAKVPTSTGTVPWPGMLMKLVLTAEKLDCASDGARKPVLAAPRITKALCAWKRSVSFPSTVLPKSL
jgi:hypothetical protein